MDKSFTLSDGLVVSEDFDVSDLADRCIGYIEMINSKNEMFRRNVHRYDNAFNELLSLQNEHKYALEDIVDYLERIKRLQT